MREYEVVPQGGCEPHRGERRGARDEAVHEHDRSGSGRADHCACHHRDLEAAVFAQRVAGVESLAGA